MAEDYTNADITRARIIRSAGKLQRKYGYNRVTLRDIADDIGIKAGSIYYHFESKDAIIRAVLEDGVGPAIEAVNAALAALPPGVSAMTKLSTALRVHVKYVIAKQFSSSLEGMRQLPKRLRDEHMAREREYAAIFSDILTELEAEGALRPGVNTKILRMFSLGALNWVSEWHDPKGEYSLDQVVDQFMMIITGGVLKDARSANSDKGGADKGGADSASLRRIAG
ncbi:MAG: TetR/AcrR family transcriptional regulator [Hyphomonadaceae bacterium]